VLLREARERADLSREDLARLAGVSSRQIYDIENDRAVPRRATRAVVTAALRRALGVDLLTIDWPTGSLWSAGR